MFLSKDCIFNLCYLCTYVFFPETHNSVGNSKILIRLSSLNKGRRQKSVFLGVVHTENWGGGSPTATLILKNYHFDPEAFLIRGFKAKINPYPRALKKVVVFWDFAPKDLMIRNARYYDITAQKAQYILYGANYFFGS